MVGFRVSRENSSTNSNWPDGRYPGKKGGLKIRNEPEMRLSYIIECLGVGGDEGTL